jgi:hypothetical protein
MSSSASEYLRRKLQALPRTYGPAIYGDASQRTAVVRYRASAKSCPQLPASIKSSCCTGGGPYNGKNGDGQQQEWSVDGLIASRVGCAPLSGTITIPKEPRVKTDCCPPDRPAGIYYDADGVPVTAAYQGTKIQWCYNDQGNKVICCPFHGTMQSVIDNVRDPSKCSCAVDRKTNINTLLANDVPNEKIPVPPVATPCCVHPIPPPAPDPCCCE